MFIACNLRAKSCVMQDLAASFTQWKSLQVTVAIEITSFHGCVARRVLPRWCRFDAANTAWVDFNHWRWVSAGVECEYFMEIGRGSAFENRLLVTSTALAVRGIVDLHCRTLGRLLPAGSLAAFLGWLFTAG